MPSAVVSSVTGFSKVTVDIGGTDYDVYTSTTASPQVIFSTGGDIDRLLNAGGGSGGVTNRGGAGGGGGAVLAGATTVTATTYNGTVGSGGVWVSNAGVNGGDTTMFGLTAFGGGGGGNPGLDGGTGGGGAKSTAGGTGSQGGNGGASNIDDGNGGGGGADTDGETVSTQKGGAGGDGIQSSITGTATYYGGGGGGGVRGAASGTFGAGGLGGGGAGGDAGGGTDGTDGLGGGGGGAHSNAGYSPGNGGDGIIIFRVETPGAGSVDFTGNAGTGAATATGAAPTVSADAQADAGTGGVTATGQAPGVGTDTVVFALGGQSNGVPRVNFDSGTDYPTDGTVKQVGRSGGSQTSNTDGVIINAVRPLDANSQPTAGGFSFHLQFALDYLAANPGHTIVFVPCNDGGTGFSNNRWNPGDALYEDMLSRFNAVLTANPSYIAGGLLWHQGEKDAEQNATGPTYEANLDAMIADFRTETGEANLPVVVSRPYDDYTTGTASAIKAVLADTPNRLTYTAFADPTGLSTSDGTHGNAAAVRTLGSRFYTAYVAAQANTTLGVTVSPGTGAATATGEAPTVSAGAQADAGTGGATATGSAPTVSTGAGVSVSPGTGAVTADGSAPTVSTGADATTEAGTGAATATGSAPTVSADASAAAGAGAVTAEGQTAAVTELLHREPSLIFDDVVVRRVDLTGAVVRRVDLTDAAERRVDLT